MSNRIKEGQDRLTANADIPIKPVWDIDGYLWEPKL